jgi:hypothetical protein
MAMGVGAREAPSPTPAPAPATVADLPHGCVGQAYPPTRIVVGGSPPYRVASSPPLPAGLAVSPSGEIAGAPREAGDFRFVLQITDAATPPHTVRSAFHLRVLAGPRHTRP